MKLNKKEIYTACLDDVNRQIEKYENELEMIRESMAANDIKTDYDEDNKGQLLGDFEQYAKYLNDSQQMKAKLSQIDLDHYSETIDFGSLIETGDAYYYVAVPIGEITTDSGSRVLCISTDSPIYENLQGKKAGDTTSFKDKEIEIVEVR